MTAESGLANKDLLPTTAEDRHWTWIDYAALWIGMAHNIPTWLMAGSLIALGLSWWQAVLIIALGNLIVLGPIVLNSHPGAKYGIPFPVLARASFGVRGALLPTTVRGIVAAIWFGIQVHVGAGALRLLVAPGAKDSTDLLGQDWIAWVCFLIFLALNLVVMRQGMHALKRFEWFAAPAVLLLAIALCVWSVMTAGGLGPIFDNPPAASDKPLSEILITGLMSVIGFWATLSLNASDFTRFSRSQRDQIKGQAIGLPGTMVLFSILGVITTSATAVIFGKVIWDPVALVPMLPSKPLQILCLLGVLLATLSVNIPANLVSASYDASNLAPKHISLWRGALLTAVLATAIMPWRLLASPDAYIFDWLGNCAIALAPIAGILIADYWLIRKKELVVEELYQADGRYRGLNWRAYLAMAAGIGLAYVGLVFPPLKLLHEMGWITAFLSALIVYRVISKVPA